MPYTTSQFSPAYGGLINSAGDVINTADAYDANNNLKVAIQTGAVGTELLFKYTEYLALANNGTVTLWTPASGKKIRLIGLYLSFSAATKVHLKDGSGGTIFNTTKTHQEHSSFLDFKTGRLFSAANNILQLQNVGGSAVDIWATAYGTEE